MIQHSVPLCEDKQCTVKNNCKRFFTGGHKKFYRNIKQWRGEECNYFISKNFATIEEQREANYEMRKEILSDNKI